MTKFGRNMKVTLKESLREPFTKMMVEVFGCEAADPMPSMRIFTLPDGFSLGIELVSEDSALDQDAFFVAPWLEFLVDDIEGTTQALLQRGATTFDYFDKAHTYFRAPGGLVFRLAAVD